MRSLSIACLIAALPLGGTALAQEKAAPALPDYSSSILTPKAPASPRINGAKVFGVRPGHPFLFTIPATGQRPMTYGAVDLPAGLKVDAGTGRITGALAAPGQYVVTLTAQNALGKAQRELRIVCGDRLALTPPLGWNSWNAGGPFVDTAKVRASARAMVETGLVQHGWSFVNIDDAWQG
jgi:alpha-galactosidase